MRISENNAGIYYSESFVTPLFLKLLSYQFVWLLIMVFVALVISSCGTTPSMKLYKNSERGVTLEQPQNWNLSYFERSGSIVLESETGIWEKESTRIEIWGPACISTRSANQEEILVSDIERIRTLYNLESITIFLEPTLVNSGDYDVSNASVAVPTVSMLNDPVRNQVGAQDPDEAQIIDIFEIRNSNDNAITVYVYRGNSEQLNAEAKAIVDSIELVCHE